MARARRHLLALLSMVAGSGLVFAFLLAMNAYTKPPQAKDKRAATEFAVKPPEKKKKATRRAPPKKRHTARSTSPRPPTPNLGGGLSSVSLDMSAFALGDMDTNDKALLGDVGKNMVMDEQSVDQPPRAVSRVAPDAYPEQARKRGVEGFVKMNLLIGTDGTVQRVKVLQAEPSGVFDQIAMSTIRRWRFEPAVYQAQHVRVWASQTMRFQLN